MVATWIGFGVLTIGAIAFWQWQTHRTLERWQQVQAALQQTNTELQQQIRDRRQAEGALQKLNQELETRVQQRTVALEQSQLHLQETRNFLQTVIDHLPIAVCVKDGRADHFGEILLWNQTSEQLFGFTAEQAIGNTVPDCFPPELTVFSAQKDQDIFSKGLSDDFSGDRIDSYSLGQRIFQTMKVPLYDEKEQSRYLLCVSEDITERKRTETALHDREERLRLAINTAKMGVWEANLQTGEQIWSPQAEAIWGFEPGRFDGTTASFLSRVHPDDRESVVQANQTARRTGKYQVEYRIVWPDQTIRWLSNRATVYYDKAGEPIRMIGIDLDVTDRKQTEAALRQSEEHYRQLAENMPTSICRFLPDSTLTYVNSAYCQYFNKTSEELIGRQFLDFLPDEADRQAAQAHYMSLTPTAPSAIYEHPVTRSDGSEGWQQWVDRAFFDAQGHITHFQSIGFDISDRKRVEIALRESEVRFRQMAENIQEVFWLRDITLSQTLYVSPAYETIWGRACASLHEDPLSFQESLHPEDRDRVLATMRDRRYQGWEQEYRILRPDGSLRWIWEQGFPIADDAGRIHRVVGLCHDISDRKQAEAKRLQAEQVRKELKLLEEILEVVLAGYWDWDIPNHTEYLSPRLKQMLGYADHELDNTPETWQRLIFAEDLPEVLACFEHHVQSQGTAPYYNEVRYHHKDGSTVWVICSGQVIEWDDAGNPLRMIGCHIDITDRKQVEMALRDSEQRYATLADFSPVGIFRNDATGAMVYANRCWSDITGLSPADGWENGWLESVKPDWRDRLINDWQHSTQAGTSYSVESCLQMRDGSLKWVYCQAQPEKDADGRLIGYVGTLTDITRLKLAEQKIQQTIAQLTATNQELESFAYSVSHDLRAPLRHIHGFVNALRQKLARHNALTDPKVQHYLEVIESSSQKMGWLIDGLLTLSRIGRKLIEPNPVALRTLVEEAMTLAQSNLETDASVEFVIGDLPTVKGDAALLQQVLSNLIGNAVKFSRHTPQPRIEVGTTAEGAIFVRDNGVGFDMKYADKLFGAFQRLHSQTEFPGTGIGLAIVQRIIHRHGGSIWAESQPNQGTTFYFTVTWQ